MPIEKMKMSEFKKDEFSPEMSTFAKYTLLLGTLPNALLEKLQRLDLESSCMFAQTVYYGRTRFEAAVPTKDKNPEAK